MDLDSDLRRYLLSPPPAPIDLVEGQSLALGDDGVPLLVAHGRCEVYLLIDDRRVFLGVASAECLIAPPDPAVARLLLLSLESSRLTLAPPDTWRRIPPQTAAAAVDAWCGLLSAALGGRRRSRPSVQSMAADERAAFSEATAITAVSGVVWLTPQNDAPSAQGMTLMGAQPLPGGVPVPVTFHSWATAPAGAQVEARSSLGVIVADRRHGRETMLAALRTYGGAVAALAASDRLGAELSETARVGRRDAQVEKSLKRSFARFYRIFSDNAMAPPQENDCAFVYQTITGQPASPTSIAAQTDDFALFAALNNARLRGAPLTDDWWRRDVGPLVARRRADGKLGALRPDWLGRYRLHMLEEPPRRVDARLAAQLEPEALILTPPLPAEPLTMARIFWIGMRLCATDAATLAVAALAAALLGLLAPIATGKLVDTFIPSALREPMLMIGVGLLAARAGVSVINLASTILRQRIDGRIAERIGSGMMDRVLRLPTGVTRNMAAAELAMRVAAVDGVRRAATGLALNGLMSGVGGAAAVILLAYYSPPGGAAAAAIIILLSAVGFFFAAKQVDLALRGDQMTMNVRAFALQIISNMPVLRAFAAERRALSQWAANSAEMQARGLRARAVGNAFEAILAGGQILAVAAIFAVLSYSSGAADALSTGGFMAFVAAFQAFLSAGTVVSRGVYQLVSLKPQLVMAQPLLNAAPETAAHARDPGAISGAIEVNAVSFHSDDGKQILKSMSFRAPAGAFVALVGPSGGGKTTLMSLLIGFETPSAGAIRYDGRDLASLDLTKLRRQIGYVRQNGRLFAGTLRENIQGPYPADLADVWRAAEQAGVADDIRAMPMGLHTVVTEGAAAFSGGQIQRLLLARALIGSPKILLLDEATSALDNIAQAHVARSIDGLGCTRVVVAHRLSAVRNADLILFIEHGRIAESGSYDELIERGGAFARYARLQATTQPRGKQ